MANTPYQTTANTNFGSSGIYQLAFQFNLADIAAADLVTTYTINHPFRVLDVRAVTTKVATTASKLATITAKIGTTAVPGASIGLTSANQGTQGAVLIGTATAQLSGGAQDGASGGTISLTGSAVTAFVEGAATVIVTIQDRADA